MFKKYIPHPTKREFFAMILLFAELILFSVFVPNFLSVDNIIRVIQNNAEVAIISIGMTIVMLMGGIDLSVGAVMGVVAVVTGTMIEKQMNTILVILVAAGIGTLVGAINGLIIAKLHIPDMLATLATGNIWKAVIFGLLGGKWLTSLKPQFAAVTTGRIFGIPILLLLVIAVYALFYYIFMYRKLGRYIYAIGNNENAALLSGINVSYVRIMSYCITGALAGLTGLLYISRMRSVEMTIGTTTAIQCIAAVTIGGIGAKGSGSRGSVIGTLAGVFFIGFLRNGIVIMGIPSLLENFFIGFFMVICVLLDSLNAMRQTKIAAGEKDVQDGGAA